MHSGCPGLGLCYLTLSDGDEIPFGRSTEVEDVEQLSGGLCPSFAICDMPMHMSGAADVIAQLKKDATFAPELWADMTTN